MQVRIRVGERVEEFGWGTVKLFGLVVVLSALIASTSRGLMRDGSPADSKTVVPAAIRAGHVDTPTVSFPATVVRILVAPGTTVTAGQLVAVLESPDVVRPVYAARRRLALSESRLNGDRPKTESAAQQLQAQAAGRGQQLAEQRLREFSLGDAEAACRAAKARTERIADLVKQHMATAGELDNAVREEEAELRNLKAARDQQSRLQQELELSKVQVALVNSQADAPVVDRGAAETEFADARAALDEALARLEELNVKARADGVVLSGTPGVGDRIYAGSPILHIADISTLSFEAPVSAALARQIRPGEPVRLRVPTEPPRHLDAQISSVALTPDPVLQNYVVRAVISNPDRRTILVGMEGAIEFPHSESKWRHPF